MFLITKQVRAYMVEHFDLEATATDDECRKAIADAILADELDIDTIKSLANSDKQAVTAKVGELVTKQVTEAVSSLKDGLIAEFKGMMDSLRPSMETVSASTETEGSGEGDSGSGDGPSGQKAYAAAAGATQVRVKSPFEQYDDTRRNVTWDMRTKSAAGGDQDILAKAWAGRPVMSGNVGGAFSYQLEQPSELALAVTGSWFKMLINRSCRMENKQVPRVFQMTELDGQMVQEIARKCRFVGPVGFQDDGYGGEAQTWFENRKAISDLEIKALLDDPGTGGIFAVPIEFDANVILTPLLHGELFPRVDVRNVSRRRIESAAIANPTVAWGTAEGTAIVPFDTTGFITAYNNNIYPLTGAMELGRDFLSDSPLDIGRIVQDRYGERFRQEMDNVIATGNGTDRPEGVFEAAGVVDVAEAGTSTAPLIGDLEGLMRAVGKEYLEQAGPRACWISSNNGYFAARAIPVGTADARRLFGLENYRSYRLFDYDYAINNGVGDLRRGFFCLNRYRMYRRAGFEVRIETGGRTLALSNQQMVVVRARFGGSLETSAAGAKMTYAA